MGVGRWRGQVVGGHNLDVGAVGEHGTQEVAPDPPKAVDPNPDRHGVLLVIVVCPAILGEPRVTPSRRLSDQVGTLVTSLAGGRSCGPVP